MRVLLIEDDLNKARHIASTLRESFDDVQIVERHSYRSGADEAVRGAFDAIVLDMSMPTYDVGVGEEGGRSKPYAGRHILRKIKRRRIKTCVVVVTQFETFIDGTEEQTLEELDQALQKDFGGNYSGTVFYQAGGSAWSAELTRIVSERCGVRRRKR